MITKSDILTARKVMRAFDHAPNISDEYTEAVEAVNRLLENLISAPTFSDPFGDGFPPDYTMEYVEHEREE